MRTKLAAMAASQLEELAAIVAGADFELCSPCPIK
jgi:hypothetical protein